jgi:hypothetical protein
VGVFPALAFAGVVAVVLGLVLLLLARQSLRGLADVAREPSGCGLVGRSRC